MHKKHGVKCSKKSKALIVWIIWIIWFIGSMIIWSCKNNFGVWDRSSWIKSINRFLWDVLQALQSQCFIRNHYNILEGSTIILERLIS
jgi:hypothetical protein